MLCTINVSNIKKTFTDGRPSLFVEENVRYFLNSVFYGKDEI